MRIPGFALASGLLALGLVGACRDVRAPSTDTQARDPVESRDPNMATSMPKDQASPPVAPYLKEGPTAPADPSVDVHPVSGRDTADTAKDDLHRAGQDTRDALRKGADDVNRAGDQAGSKIDEGAKDLGHRIDKAATDVKKDLSERNQ